MSAVGQAQAVGDALMDRSNLSRLAWSGRKAEAKEPVMGCSGELVRCHWKAGEGKQHPAQRGRCPEEVSTQLGLGRPAGVLGEERKRPGSLVVFPAG